MDQHPTNPESNEIPSGLSDEQIENAVRQSGYPLQSAIARQLSHQMTTIVEEWGYSDRTTGEHRALDIFAQRELAPSSDRLAPQLILLVECKRSDLPYVFFASARMSRTTPFPSQTNSAPV